MRTVYTITLVSGAVTVALLLLFLGVCLLMRWRTTAREGRQQATRRCAALVYFVARRMPQL